MPSHEPPTPLLARTTKNKNFRKEVLEGIVTANGFFTAAVFLGVTGTVLPLPSIPLHCVAGDDIARGLFLSQVWSFGLYLVSSLMALGMKLGINSGHRTVYVMVAQRPEQQWQQQRWLFYSAPDYATDTAHTQSWLEPDPKGGKNNLLGSRRLLMLPLLFSAGGSSFLLVSMIYLIQIKLGLFSCRNTAVVFSVVGIALFIPLGLGAYLTILVKILK